MRACELVDFLVVSPDAVKTCFNNPAHTTMAALHDVTTAASVVAGIAFRICSSRSAMRSESTAVVVDEKLRDGGRPSPLEFLETGPSLQELGRNIGTDFIEPGEHLREVHLQMRGKPI